MTQGQGTDSTPDALLREGRLAGTWTLDAARSEVRLRSKGMWGLAPVKGAFGRVSGEGVVAPDGSLTGTVTVAADSIDTKNSKRDTHLRSADFFDAANHPNIVFTVDGIRPSGHTASVTGSLTVRGRTRPLSFDANVSIPGPGEVRLETEIPVNRADFGLTWNQLGVASMHSRITIRAVFTRR